MKKIILIIITLVPVLSLAQNVRECDYQITSNNFVGTISTAEQTIAHSFTITRNNNSQNCENYRAFFTTGRANSYNRQAYQGSKTVPYNLYKNSSSSEVLKDFGDAQNSGNYVQGSVNRNSNSTNNFYIKLPQLDAVFSNGRSYYNDLIEVKFYSVKQGTNQLTYQNSTYINIGIRIPAFAELSIVAPNAPHNPSATTYVMSFGTLQKDNVQSATLNIKSTVPYGLHMASQNGSYLVNQSSQIPYQIEVGDVNYRSLNGAGRNHYITQDRNQTSVNAKSYPINVKIGTLPNTPSTGDYTDSITITVTAY